MLVFCFLFFSHLRTVISYTQMRQVQSQAHLPSPKNVTPQNKALKRNNSPPAKLVQGREAYRGVVSSLCLLRFASASSPFSFSRMEANSRERKARKILPLRVDLLPQCFSAWLGIEITWETLRLLSLCYSPRN